MLVVGVISDTHGLLRPQVVTELAGSDLILHAGDVGSFEVLDRLEEIAPVHAVLGNTDGGELARSLPDYLSLALDGVPVLLHHGHLQPPESELSRAKAVIQGHSHRPVLDWRDGVLHLNPGSAGARRFSLPVSLARLRVGGRKLEAELIDLSQRL